MEHRIVNPWTWQDAYGFVQGHEVSGAQRVLFCAGQTSNDADGAPLHTGDIRAQVNQAFDNLEAVLNEAGFGLADVVRINYYTTDVDLLLQNWDAITSRLGAAGCRPASTLLGITRLANPDWLIEIEATAVK